MKALLTVIIHMSFTMPCLLADERFENVTSLIERRCGECHTGNASKGGFSMNSRQSLLHGSDNGKVLESGKGKDSLLIELITSEDDGEWMPPKGDRLSKNEVSLLKKWIDDDLEWQEGFVFNNSKRATTPFHKVVIPPGAQKNPIDRFLALKDSQLISDRMFIRRVTLDLTGLLPDPEKVEAFVTDPSPNKSPKLIDDLLADQIAYADHWLSFWNDLLRNSYYGTGYIDGGRQQITDWLYKSLLDNKPYDQFARELITGAPGAEGYIKGIVWRGVVNASQRPVVQAAQNVSQVFLGTNLKCASCHDSFIDGWTLKEAYSFASIFSEKGQMPIVRCNRPSDKTAKAGMLFPELGVINANAPLPERRKQAAALLTSENNGLFARTMVNRLWKIFFGYGLVEPIDFMANPSWNDDLLNWLAWDFKEHGYDLKHTMQLICTSQAYAMPAVGMDTSEEMMADDYAYIFQGPYVRRMTAEQFMDAVSVVTFEWNKMSARDMDPERKYRGQGGQTAALAKAQKHLWVENQKMKEAHQGKVPIDVKMRASATQQNDFMRMLGRPTREQVVTQRDTLATTLQALELTNGKTLDSRLREGAKTWLSKGLNRDSLVTNIHLKALGRKPTLTERKVAYEIFGEEQTTSQKLSDYLWIVLMLPEFELIY